MCGESSTFQCLDPDSNSSHCNVGFPDRIGNGVCDTFGYYNTEACDWDGGDCCQSTCEDPDESTGCYYSYDDIDCDYYVKYNGVSCVFLEMTFEFNCAGCLACTNDESNGQCANHGKVCRNPNATDFGQCELATDFVESIVGNGVCDNYGGINTEICGWDGGDCCSDTCTSIEQDTSGCIDTEYDCDYYVEESSYTCMELEELGHDCSGCSLCAPPCEEDLHNKFCLDPNSTLYADCNVPFPEYLGDFYCDRHGQYNTKNCNWDDGDCCEVTCSYSFSDTLLNINDNDISAHNCNGTHYECLDPQFECKGHWSGWGKCDTTCSSGYQSRTFTVTVNATGGGIECAASHNDVEKRTCETRACDYDNDGIEDSVDSCAKDAENDIDSDEVCGNVDDCPYDSNDDRDGDNICDGDDTCTFDAANDYDSDELCADIDSCPEDPFNDYDSDSVCNVLPPCDSTSKDSDSDEICNQDDVCPYDAGNDFDSDGLCADVDPCPIDSLNDADSDGLCDSRDVCIALESKIGDGICDASDKTFSANGTYNTMVCDWDGGDCCVESCTKEIVDLYYSYEIPCEADNSSSFFCQDPQFKQCSSKDESQVGDGYCDSAPLSSYNTEKCNWDGGDCCEISCLDTKQHTCGSNNYSCQNPAYKNVIFPFLSNYSGISSGLRNYISTHSAYSIISGGRANQIF